MLRRVFAALTPFERGVICCIGIVVATLVWSAPAFVSAAPVERESIPADSAAEVRKLTEMLDRHLTTIEADLTRIRAKLEERR